MNARCIEPAVTTMGLETVVWKGVWLKGSPGWRSQMCRDKVREKTVAALERGPSSGSVDEKKVDSLLGSKPDLMRWFAIKLGVVLIAH
jgi:hypothetical protein